MPRRRKASLTDEYKAHTREAIVAAAHAQVAEDGYASASVVAVARRPLSPFAVGRTTTLRGGPQQLADDGFDVCAHERPR